MEINQVIDGYSRVIYDRTYNIYLLIFSPEFTKRSALVNEQRSPSLRWSTWRKRDVPFA